MTTATVAPAPRAAGAPALRLRWLIDRCAVMTGAVLARIAREPETLMDVTVQPVIFVLLFAYVSAGPSRCPAGELPRVPDRRDARHGAGDDRPGTAVALVTDMHTGLIDRFRSLPMPGRPCWPGGPSPTW